MASYFFGIVLGDVRRWTMKAGRLLHNTQGQELALNGQFLEAGWDKDAMTQFGNSFRSISDMGVKQCGFGQLTYNGWDWLGKLAQDLPSKYPVCRIVTRCTSVC